MPFRSAFAVAAALASPTLAVREASVLAPAETVDGVSAELSENGYQIVADLKNTQEMEAFVLRVIESEGLKVVGEHHLQGMLPFYSGQCSTQGFDELLAELHEGQTLKNKCKPAWLAASDAPEEKSAFLQTEGKQATAHPNFFTWLFSSFFAMPSIEEPAGEAEFVQDSGNFVTHTGMFAALDNRGYLAVAASHSKFEMGVFVQRLLEDMKLRVKDDGSMQGMLPYYDGECEVQSFGALQAELERGLNRPSDCMGGPWLERM